MTILGIGLEVYVLNLIIAVPVFFLARWVFRRFIDKPSIQSWCTWISTIALTPIVYIAGALIWMTIYFGQPTREFDKQLWVENPELRHEMYSDLAELLIGLTKEEVETILGQIDPDMYIKEHWEYYLGFGSGLGVDLDYLDIYFEDGKVVKVGRHRS